jgi:hypothetical protein
MSMSAYERRHEEADERERRYGLEPDEQEDFEAELELADRIADQCSLPPGHPVAMAAARHRLYGGPSPYEQPHEPEPSRLAPGERVVHHCHDDIRSGRVVRVLDFEGLAEVDFGPHGRTIVAADELEPETGASRGEPEHGPLPEGPR